MMFKWSKNKIIIVTVFTLVIVFISFYLLLYVSPTPQTVLPSQILPVSSLPSPPESVSEKPALAYPIGQRIITLERKSYNSGDMLLEIPRLSLSVPVLSGVDPETLSKGPGLFDQSFLPGTDNQNVSIAAHRDIHNMEFYYIDTITDGDLMYLSYGGKRYTYQYLETIVTDEYDWGPIATTNYSRITLQSCTPINVASHRIFVIGKLLDVYEIKD